MVAVLAAAELCRAGVPVRAEGDEQGPCQRAGSEAKDRTQHGGQRGWSAASLPRRLQDEGALAAGPRRPHLRDPVFALRAQGLSDGGSRRPRARVGGRRERASDGGWLLRRRRDGGGVAPATRTHHRHSDGLPSRRVGSAASLRRSSLGNRRRYTVVRHVAHFSRDR